MFNYVGLFRMTPVARENLVKTPEYFEKIHEIVELERQGRPVPRDHGPLGVPGHLYVSGPRGRVRALGKIAKLEDLRDGDVPRRRRR